MGKVAVVIPKSSCLKKVLAIIPLLLKFLLHIRYNPTQNNNLNSSGKYLKFRNRLKFYVPYFFSPLWTKHTQKDKHAFLQNKFTTHNSKVGTTSRFVEQGKEKANLWKHYLPTYPPLCFVTFYFQTCIPLH
jgi:hypothetical protein